MEFKQVVLGLLFGLAFGGLAVGVPVASVNADNKAIIQEYKQEIENKDSIIANLKEQINDNETSEDNNVNVNLSNAEITLKAFEEYTGNSLSFKSKYVHFILSYGENDLNFIMLSDGSKTSGVGSVIKDRFVNYEKTHFSEQYVYDVLDSENNKINTTSYTTPLVDYLKADCNLEFNFVDIDGNSIEIDTLLNDTKYTCILQNVEYTATNESFALSCDVVIEIEE